MKTKFLVALAFVAMLFSCSSDDNGQTPDDEGSGDVYLPLNNGDYWTYRVTDDANAPLGRDSLYVANDTTINGKTYKKFKTLNQPLGFFSNSLNNNGLRKSGASLLLSGEAGLNLGDTFPIDLVLNDFVIFKENASDNQELSTLTGVIEQDYEGYPLKLDYTMKTTSIQTLPSFTSPDGEVYTNVKKVKTILNLKVTTTVTIPGLPTPLVVTIMNPQDVVVSYQYYSKNIGMVHANTTISYELTDLSAYGFELPIPQSGSQVQKEFLDTYEVD
jgi:hypothetical protein